MLFLEFLIDLENALQSKNVLYKDMIPCKRKEWMIKYFLQRISALLCQAETEVEIMAYIYYNSKGVKN